MGNLTHPVLPRGSGQGENLLPVLWQQVPTGGCSYAETSRG